MIRASLWAALAVVGCSEGAAPTRGPAPTRGAAAPARGSGATVPAPPAAMPDAAPRRPALAAWPRLDLAANALRFQTHDRGLVIPVGGEGLRQFDLEYQRPWGPAEIIDGDHARRLRGRAATLTVPWPGGPGTVAVTARGARAIKVALDGRPAGAIAMAAGGWGRGEMAFDLPVGDHRLTLTADRRAAAFSSIELFGTDGAGRDAAGATCPAPRPASAAPGGTLGGWPELRVAVEVPRAAYLLVTPAGRAGDHLAIEVRREAAARDVLWTGTGTGTGSDRELVLDLAAYGDEIVELRFVGGCDARWRGAAIAVAARDLAPAPAPVANAILVVIDSLRADRVAAMGPTRVATPRLSEAAARGVAFQRHQAMAPSSPPSHATIHTGQLPRVHGVAGDDPPLAANAPVLARIAGDAGLWTGYIGNNDFAMGRLRAAAAWREASTPALDGRGNECSVVVRGVLDMVAAARAAGRRYFISALPIQPHAPYRYHAGITEKYFAGPFAPPLRKRVTSAVMARVKARGLTPIQWEQYRGLYDGEVEQVDACIGGLLDGLAALGATDDTAIIITSDHGEGMGERGRNVGHAYGLYHELISVPLIVVAPGLAPATVDTVTSAIDVAPTVLDLLGLPPDPRMQGASLVTLARFGAGGPGRIAASEYGRSYAVRAGAWRYVVGYDGAGALYDVAADPAELVDASARAPIALRYLRGAAGLYLAHRTAWRAAAWGTLGDLAARNPLAEPAAP